MSAWGSGERAGALARASREGVDLLVVGGGISGAGVLRDAASRGLRALLVERDDFASGTSGRSSKLVHGGLRYLAEGQLGVTREAVRERDRLMRQNPNLIRPLPFLFPAWKGGKVPLWQVRAALLVYSALGGFRRSTRFRHVSPAQIGAYCPDLRQEGLRGGGLYGDARVDDARLVLEVLKSARRLGAAHGGWAEAANHAELVAFERDGGRRIAAARVRDAHTGATWRIPAHAVVNAAGPGVERVRGLDRPDERPALRPAKGVHLVIRRERIPAQGAVTFEAPDGRHLFLLPWDDVALVGTTDAFTGEIDEPVVTIQEVHYLLAAANDAFPHAALTTNDLCCVFAGVRPLAAGEDETTPSTSLSRDYRIWDDPSGLVSVAGGKLTTHRATGEAIVDRVLQHLPAARRAAAGPSRTAQLPLREDAFEREELIGELEARFDLDERLADHLVEAWGGDAPALLEAAAPELRRPIGTSRFLYAEIPWALRRECPASLCDLLERRLRLALFAVGQGLAELPAIAEVAAAEAGWDAERVRAECDAYRAAVRRSYQIRIPQARGGEPDAAPASAAA